MNATLHPAQFSIGQVVRLVGGGPAMTIDNIERTGLVHCKWFVGSTLHAHLFQPNVLEPLQH